MPPKASRRKGKKPGPKKGSKRGGFLGALFGNPVTAFSQAFHAAKQYNDAQKKGGKRKRGGFDYKNYVSPGPVMLRAPPPKFKLMPLGVTI